MALCALLNEVEAEAAQDAPIQTTNAFEYLRKHQNNDGGWGDTGISKSNLAATLLVLCADAVSRRVRIASGSLLQPEALAKAEVYAEQRGGLNEGLRRVYGKDLTFQVPIRVTAAYAGKLDWRKVDALPLELALAPHALMGAIGLPVVSYALPALVCMGLARHHQAPTRIFPLRWLRSASAEKTLDRILKMQPESGGYLEASPITAFCLLGLKAAGRAEHPVARNAKRFLIETQRSDGSWPVEVNLSLWNTTRAVEALSLTGTHEKDSESLEEDQARTRDWLLGQQTQSIHPYTQARPGGWGWNHFSGSVPDADDTAGAILALRGLGLPADHPALVKGRDWLLGLQNRDGGWPTFCRGWMKLPFDQSAPDLTAHALRALDVLRESESEAVRSARVRGWNYLRRVQGADGSFKPLWFGCETAEDEMNATYGTTHVLFACTAGNQEHKDIAERALKWLRSIQNVDGGFGGAKGAPSTVEETGLAIRALAGHGFGLKDPACQKAARWLIERQAEDGTWPHAPIGFYFAVLWYYEEMYPLTYALGGLAALAASSAAKS